MNDNLLTYNRAISLIHKGRYDESSALLKSLAGFGHSNTHWPLGLIEAALGRPYQALKHWERVSAAEVPAVQDKLEKLQVVLPLYNEIFNQYNEILAPGKMGFADLDARFAEILDKGSSIPLPAEIYKGYFLALLLKDRKVKFLEELEMAPAYVKNDPAVKRLLLKLNEAAMEESSRHGETKRTGAKRMAAGILIGAAAIFALAAGGVFDKEEKAVPSSAAESRTKADRKEVKALEEQLAKLEQEKDSLKEEVDKKETELQKKDEEASQLDAPELTAMKEEAALANYEEGRQAFKNAAYKTAASKLNKSLSFSKTIYVADDAHYLLIESLVKRGESAEEAMDEFLAEKTDVYKESPYLDDVMLMKAESLLKSGDEAGAENLLLEIEKDFPDEWTAKKAKSYLKR